MKLSQILHDAAGAASRFFEAPKGFAQILGQPVYPLPAYLTLRHLEKHQSPYDAFTKRDGCCPEIGDIECEGEHKGEIYGGIWTEEYGGDNKPIWYSQLAPRLMNHFEAVAWAKEQGGSLPTLKQGAYLTTLKGKGGAFTEIFNRRSWPAGYVWLADLDPDARDSACCQSLSVGDRNDMWRNLRLAVLSVRR